MGIYPQVRLPTGNSWRGLGEGRASYFLPLVAQKSWGKLTVYGDADYVVQVRETSPNFWY
jgi:hypothetical protein